MNNKKRRLVICEASRLPDTLSVASNAPLDIDDEDTVQAFEKFAESGPAVGVEVFYATKNYPKTVHELFEYLRVVELHRVCCTISNMEYNTETKQLIGDVTLSGPFSYEGFFDDLANNKAKFVVGATLSHKSAKGDDHHLSTKEETDDGVPKPRYRTVINDILKVQYKFLEPEQGPTINP